MRNCLLTLKSILEFKLEYGYTPVETNKLEWETLKIIEKKRGDIYNRLAFLPDNIEKLEVIKSYLSIY